MDVEAKDIGVLTYFDFDGKWEQRKLESALLFGFGARKIQFDFHHFHQQRDHVFSAPCLMATLTISP